MKYFFGLILAICLSGCGPNRPHNTPYLLPFNLTNTFPHGSSGFTPRGIVWFAQFPVDRADVEAQIDAEATDINYTVIIVPAAFVYTPDQNELFLGTTDTANKRIIVAAASGAKSLPYLRHEYHHVALFNTTGNADSAHSDPSWAIYY